MTEPSGTILRPPRRLPGMATLAAAYRMPWIAAPALTAGDTPSSTLPAMGLQVPCEVALCTRWAAGPLCAMHRLSDGSRPRR